VTLEDPPGAVLLRVRDDGRGFDARAQEGGGGRLGLRLMREHAAMAGGRVEVSSAPGRGTQVTLYCPLPSTAPRRRSPTTLSG